MVLSQRRLCLLVVLDTTTELRPEVPSIPTTHLEGAEEDSCGTSLIGPTYLHQLSLHLLRNPPSWVLRLLSDLHSGLRRGSEPVPVVTARPPHYHIP